MTGPSEEERVREVLSRYCHAIDYGDTENWINLFTEDAVWDGGAFGTMRGKAELVKVIEGVKKRAANGGSNSRHLTSNPIVSVRGSEANLKAYISLLQKVGPGDLKILMAGVYDIQLVKRDGRWLIQVLRVTIDLQ